MKKIIVSLLLIFMATTAYSQLFNVGIKAGYNSSLSFSSLESGINYTPRNAFSEFGHNFHIGAFGRLHFGKLYVQPELLYSKQQKSYTYDLGSGAPSLENIIDLSSVDVPLLVGYRLLDLKVANIRAFAGPKFRFNAGSKIDLNLQDQLVANAANVGLDIGIGADVLMFTFDIRYGLIGNLYDIPSDVKNGLATSTFIFSLGWKIL